LAEIWLPIALSIVNWLHLWATGAWIGAMATNLLVLLPSIRETMEPTTAGQAYRSGNETVSSISVWKHHYVSSFWLVMTALNRSYLGPLQFGNAWTLVILI